MTTGHEAFKPVYLDLTTPPHISSPFAGTYSGATLGAEEATGAAPFSHPRRVTSQIFTLGNGSRSGVFFHIPWRVYRLKTVVPFLRIRITFPKGSPILAEPKNSKLETKGYGMVTRSDWERIDAGIVTFPGALIRPASRRVPGGHRHNNGAASGLGAMSRECSLGTLPCCCFSLKRVRARPDLETAATFFRQRFASTAMSPS